MMLIMQVGGRKPRAAGIVGIERKRELQHKSVDKNISQAFTDLSKLMDKVMMIGCSQKQVK